MVDTEELTASDDVRCDPELLLELIGTDLRLQAKVMCFLKF